MRHEGASKDLLLQAKNFVHSFQGIGHCLDRKTVFCTCIYIFICFNQMLYYRTLQKTS